MYLSAGQVRHSVLLYFLIDLLHLFHSVIVVETSKFNLVCSILKEKSLCLAFSPKGTHLSVWEQYAGQIINVVITVFEYCPAAFFLKEGAGSKLQTHTKTCKHTVKETIIPQENLPKFLKSTNHLPFVKLQCCWLKLKIWSLVELTGIL